MGVGFSVDQLEELLSDVEVPVPRSRGASNGKVATASPREIFRNYRDVIPRSVIQQLSAKTAVGDRSKVLWKITNALLECGLTPGEVVVLVEPTPWNKFGEDRSRLWADVNKAAARRTNNGVPSRTTQKTKPSRKGDHTQPFAVPLERYLSVESQDPRWMIEGLWSDKSHGIIAGEPKTRKSYLAIDIALSVATGTKCLGVFEVTTPGPVLMIQEEISDAEMRKRLRYISGAKELGGRVETRGGAISVHLPHAVPLLLRNRKQFDLTSVDDLEQLNRVMNDQGTKLLILDPLQMMLGSVDENRASDVRPILQNLLKLKEATGSGIMIVHHYAKASAQNPRQGGQRMLGSQAFHGWVESALYLSKPDPYITLIERENRNFEPMPDIEVEYVGGNEAYEVEVTMEKSKEVTRKKPTEFELFCMRHEDASVLALAKHFKVSDNAIRGRIEKSDYLTLGKKRFNAKGRPRTVVKKSRGR